MIFYDVKLRGGDDLLYLCININAILRKLLMNELRRELVMIQHEI
jgi:hypothetical protein